MEIRNVQKTGNMHYVYLPTSWCKMHKVSSKTKVSVTTNHDGSLQITPELSEIEQKEIKITLPEADSDTLIKLIMACYLNPCKSFRIEVEKEVDISKILNKEARIAAMEFVDLDGNSISHESSIAIKDPYSLLKTMVKKIRNLVKLMVENYDSQLIEKYEEEIDRSKLLITKAVIGSMSMSEPLKLKTLELHYMGLLSIELERMVDNVIHVKDEKFLKGLLKPLDVLKELVEDDQVDLNVVIEFERSINKLKVQEVKDIITYRMRRVKRNFTNVSEIFFDWYVSKDIDTK